MAHARYATQVFMLFSAVEVIIGLHLYGLPDDTSNSVNITCDPHQNDGTRDGMVLIDPEYAEADQEEVDVMCGPRGKQGRPIPDAPKTWSRLLRTSPGHADLPRIIWQAWEQGKDNISVPLNRVCMRQWAKLNPDWQQTVIAKDGVGKAFPKLAELFERNPRTIQQRADMLRLWILAEHGGVWSDLSVLPLMPLDKFVRQAVEPAGFWTFHFSPEEEGHVTSWFLAAMPRNPLVLRWRDSFVERWEEFGGRFSYFELHHTLIDLVRQGDPAVKEVYGRMPKVHEDFAHICGYVAACSRYWDATTPEQRAPMLKRPFNHKSEGPPEVWWEKYYEAMRDVEA